MVLLASVNTCLLQHCMLPDAGIECFEVAAEVEMGPASRLTGALHAVALTLMNSRVSTFAGQQSRGLTQGCDWPCQPGSAVCHEGMHQAQECSTC
jgi:hypothetical protein